MSPGRVFLLTLCSLPGVITFIELLLRLPLRKRVSELAAASNKAIHVIRSPSISDHWKEKAVPRYARQTMALSISLTFYLIVLFMVFSVVFCLMGLVFLGSLREVLELTYNPVTLVLTVFLGTFYALLRKKIRKPESRSSSDYNLPSRILHHIALGNSAVKEMAFDIDCMMTRYLGIKSSSPVFVSGLARAGTSILLEALYSTGSFATLTYRDMPFVTAPYLWSRITAQHRVRESSKKERAHGDRLYVNYDSPEAFEEAFWLTFTDPPYVKDTHLEIQSPDENLSKKYRKYVGNILARHRDSPPRRYLAKNNNNLTRINTIISAFPDAIIIVPFRNPADHAKSLQIQHERFLQRHAEDPFSLKYMNWLGHFEFGANFKPFNVSPRALPETQEEPENFEYWMRYWECVYAFLLERHAADVIFFDYDELCDEPESVLSRLEERLALGRDSLKEFSANIECARRHVSQQGLPSQIQNTYDLLRGLSL